MAVDRKLLEKARRSPHALSFEEAVQLGRELGFQKVRQVRGHRIFHHAALSAFSLQKGPNGRAKAYQVRRMLEAAKARAHA